MKILPVIITAIVLSGCAHSGYQRGYVGYGSGYSTGYGVQRYYDDSPSMYYRQGGFMPYGQYYVSPSFSHEHHDHDRDRDRHEEWRSIQHRRDRQRDGDAGRHDADRHDSMRWNRGESQHEPMHSDRREERGPRSGWSMPAQRRHGGEGETGRGRESNRSGFAPADMRKPGWGQADQDSREGRRGHHRQ